MDEITLAAEPAVQDLMLADEDQLYAQLGIRAQALRGDLSASASFAPAVTYDGNEMGPMDEVIEFGRRLFGRWNRELNELVCGTSPTARKDRNELANRLGISPTAAAAYLAGILVTSFGLMPALAAVAAAIVVKRFFQPAVEEFCDAWAKAV